MRQSSRRKKHTPQVNPSNLDGIKYKQTPKKETRALVVIEQTKIRKKYIQGCKKTIKELEKVKKEWEDYLSIDVPTYEKWYNVNFGSDLSQIREAHEKARDLSSTIQEIQYWVLKKDISPYESYKLVMDRRANPEKYKEMDEAEEKREREQEHKWKEKFGKNFFDEDDEYDDEDDFYEDENDLSEEELRKMFEMFINSNPSVKSKMKDKAFYEFMFERFKEDVLGKKSSTSSTSSHKNNSIEDQIKAIYRILVRKLHPDFQTEITPHMQDLWHEVQSAYKANDLERLETILAISNIQTGEFSAEISVSQILNVQSEYKHQLKSLRSQIRKAKKKVQWGFSKLTNTKSISKQIKTELKIELDHHRHHIQEFENQLKAWSKPMVRVSKNRYVYV